MLDIFVMVAAISTIGSYIWSVNGHFESSALETGAKLISLMVIVCAGTFSWLTWTHVQPLGVQLVGVLLQLGSLLLFWTTIRETRNANLLAAFTDKNPSSLVVTGPYSLVRHPFYSSYILFWLGWAVATANMWSVALSLVMLVLYWRAAIQEEDKFATTSMAGEYEKFKRGRKRFIPFIL